MRRRRGIEDRRLLDLERIADLLAQRALLSLSEARARVAEVRDEAAAIERRRTRLASAAPDLAVAARAAAADGYLRARMAAANRELASSEARAADLGRTARSAIGRREAVRAIRRRCM